MDTIHAEMCTFGFGQFVAGQAYIRKDDVYKVTPQAFDPF